MNYFKTYQYKYDMEQLKKRVVKVFRKEWMLNVYLISVALITTVFIWLLLSTYIGLN